jgi:mannose-6-phosphate isomerase-like protein (cupin superfamily)
MSTTDTSFDPNRSARADCMARVEEALKATGRRLNSGIVTSRDADASELRDALAITNVPAGFTKHQLPVYLPESSFLFLTVAEPGAASTKHSHDEGDGIRFIVSGSIEYEGVELTAGDWMFVPRGAEYSFTTGRMGAVMCYCYCCCCA